MSKSIYGNNRTSYMKRIPSAMRGPQTLTVESRSRDGGGSANNFVVNLAVPIHCETNQAIGYYLKEAHLPLGAWTINRDFDRFQIGFPWASTAEVHTITLRHGRYNAEDFAAMVQDALNMAFYDASTHTYVQHTHLHNEIEADADLKDLIELEVVTYNSTRPKLLGGTLAPALDATAIDNSTALSSYVTFKVEYVDSLNRFAIMRTDPGRLYRSGQFDLAFEHYQIAKCFGCPWGGTLQKDGAIETTSGVPNYYTKSNPDGSVYDTRFYAPRHEAGHSGIVRDSTGTWWGNSQGKTFENKHAHYVLSSERWLASDLQDLGPNVYHNPSGSTPQYAHPEFSSLPLYDRVEKVPLLNPYSQAIQMPYSSRIRGDDCFYIRSSLFGSDNIQTHHSGGTSDCLQMVKVDTQQGSVAFWRPTYSPEPHIITRRDIPSISFSVTDKDHNLVDFNGEEILLEIEFVTFDLVTIPIIRPPADETYSAPHNFAPDYGGRVFERPITQNSHVPRGFANYR